jgi:hypothetical protein
VLKLVPFAKSVTVTEAAGITAPVESTTVPEMEPVIIPCPRATIPPKRISAQITAMSTIRCDIEISFI